MQEMIHRRANDTQPALFMEKCVVMVWKVEVGSLTFSLGNWKEFTRFRKEAVFVVMVGELLCVIPVQEVVSGDVVFPFRARVSKANFSGFCLSAES